MRYLWPGNIRELENLIERAYIIETNSYLTPESFPSELFGPEAGETRVSLDTSMKLAEVRKKAVENVEAEYLKELLVSCKGRINHTAKAAGLTPRQLNNLMKKHGLQKKDFKVNKKEK